MEARNSLRERSKAKRRVAIQRAALRLFAEQGYEGTTIAQIADAAEVAPRTVAMYFPSKLDIALSTSVDLADRVTAAFGANPDRSFTEIIDRWLTTEADLDDDGQLFRMTNAMFAANPALRAISVGNLGEAERLAGPALANESGLEVDDPMFPVVAAAATAATSEYLTRYLGEPHDPAFQRTFVRSLSAIIRSGRRR